MNDKLTQDVQAAVDNIFKQKEEVAMRKETEEALNRSAEKIDELNTTLEARDSEVSTSNEEIAVLNTKVAELEATISEFESEKENLEKERAESEAVLIERAEKAETELETIKKDQLARARFVELSDAGISANDEKAVEDQINKIREMAQEEFEAYKAELVSIREAIVAKLQSSEEVSDETVSDPESEEAVIEESQETAEEEVEVIEAEAGDIETAVESEDSIDPMKAVAAALNMEVVPNKDMMSKYKALGVQMAQKYVKEGN